MYSSVKFLSPITTAGLPTPGPVLAAWAGPPLVDVLGVAGVDAVLDVALDAAALDAVLLELDDELPHAASTLASATASAGASKRHRWERFMFPPACCWSVLVKSCRLGDERREDGDVVAALSYLQAAWGQESLDAGQRGLDHERQRGNADRSAEHT